MPYEGLSGWSARLSIQGEGRYHKGNRNWNLGRDGRPGLAGAWPGPGRDGRRLRRRLRLGRGDEGWPGAKAVQGFFQTNNDKVIFLFSSGERKVPDDGRIPPIVLEAGVKRGMGAILDQIQPGKQTAGWTA